MAEPRNNVFLSYSKRDQFQRPLRRLVADLEALQGIHLEIEGEDNGALNIAEGAQFSQYHAATLYSMDFFVPVVTRNSAFRSWALREHVVLRRGTVRIVPVLLDDLSAPQYLRLVNAISFVGNYRKAFLQLAQVLQAPSGQLLATFPLDVSYGGQTVLDIAAGVDRKLIDYFAAHPDDMRTMDRRLFEELVAELFHGFGYDVELTRRTRDGGRDVIAIASREVRVKYLIECKRPDPGHAVGVSAVRALYGVKIDEGATKAILATTAHFSRDAMLLFDRHSWELEPRDFRGVLEWVSRYVADLP